MIGEKPKGVRAHLPLAYPALMLGIFFIIPFGIMVAVSFFHRQPGGFYIPGFEFTNYKNLYTALFGRTLSFSLFVAGLSAAVCVSLAFPFTYFITRMRRRTRCRGSPTTPRCHTEDSEWDDRRESCCPA